ncbi:MAG: PEP-CTERM sorting domain-containing protein [Planctomycetota bacterium]
MRKCIFSAAAAAVFGISTVASAAIVYDEAVDGDFSNDAGAPTPVVLVDGLSTISGTIGGAEGRDVFTFTIGAGESVDSIILAEYSQDNTTSMDVDLDGSDLGLVTLRDEFVTGELLGTQVLGTDVALPSSLGPGTYVFNLAEFGAALDYQLDITFVGAAIPEPASLGLLSAAGLGLIRRRK